MAIRRNQGIRGYLNPGSGRSRSREVGADSFNQQSLYRDIQDAQRARVASGMKVGREATEAAQAAGAIEAGRIAASRGMGGGMEEALRGAMSAGQADALAASEARRRARLLDDVQAIGTQMTEKAAGKAAERAERKAQQAAEAGTALALGTSLGSGALDMAGDFLGKNLLPKAFGPIGFAFDALGLIGQAASGNEQRKAKNTATDIGRKASEFAAEKLPQTTKGLEQVVSMDPGYSSFESSFLGGQGSRRPRRMAQAASPFADALGDISFIE